MFIQLLIDLMAEQCKFIDKYGQHYYSRRKVLLFFNKQMHHFRLQQKKEVKFK